MRSVPDLKTEPGMLSISIIVEPAPVRPFAVNSFVPKAIYSPPHLH